MFYAKRQIDGCRNAERSGGASGQLVGVVNPLHSSATGWELGAELSVTAPERVGKSERVGN